MKWRAEAACIGEDPELFFDPRRLDSARRVCAGCPVRTECLRDALARQDRWAVRGGRTPRERRQLPAGPTTAKLASVDDSLLGGASQQPAEACTAFPPDPDAEAHRAVLLRELAIFHKRFKGPDRLAGPRPHDDLAAVTDNLARAGRRSARRASNAYLPVQPPVASLQREYWRRAKQRQRAAQRGQQSNAA